MSLGKSYYYPLFWELVQRQKNSLQQLIYEIEVFEPSKDDITNITSSPFYQDVSDEEIRKWIMQMRFSGRTMDITFSIIVFTSFFIEGLMNDYILTKAKTKTIYKDFIRKINAKGKSVPLTLQEKITELPKKFNAEYRLSEELINQLKLLLERRNTLAHNEPTITINGEVVFEGAKFTSIGSYQLLFDWIELPKRLFTTLISYDNSDELWAFRLSIEQLFDKSPYKKEEHLEKIGKEFINPS